MASTFASRDRKILVSELDSKVLVEFCGERRDYLVPHCFTFPKKLLSPKVKGSFLLGMLGFGFGTVITTDYLKMKKKTNRTFIH